MSELANSEIIIKENLTKLQFDTFWDELETKMDKIIETTPVVLYFHSVSHGIVR